MFLSVTFIVGLLSGATASLVGFGIGSLLTPLLALRFGTPTAVALVALPHAAATLLRCWRLRRHVDLDVLIRFGVLSAAGALGGALLYTHLGPGQLTRVVGGLMLLTAVAQVTGWNMRWRPPRPIVALFGLFSGICGGLAGNQGGLRSAALVPFGLTPRAFVATSTAVGLMVDAVRTPLYLWHAGSTIVTHWIPMGVATVGVLCGTLLGERVLMGLSRDGFGRVLGVAVGILGAWLLTGPV